MKNIYRNRIPNLMAVLLCSVVFTACEEFVETDLPVTETTADAVFNDKVTAEAALLENYVSLRDRVLTTGTIPGIGNLMGMYADESLNWQVGSIAEQAFFTNALTPSDAAVQNLWNDSYKIIYQCNRIIDGVAQSPAVTAASKDQLTGEALFTRSFVHFYLVQLFGEVPYVTSTDYRVNKTVGKMPVNAMYTQLAQDLVQAGTLLENAAAPVNTRPSKYAAEALLARLYLYAEQYDKALEYSNSVIAAGFSVDQPVEDTFLKGGKSIIWSLKPGVEGANTNEALIYIVTGTTPASRSLSENLVASFEQGDLRKELWIKKMGTENAPYYHAFKYREKGPTAATKEHSVLLRLEEMLLIRLEADLHLGNNAAALHNWNSIRERYGLDPFTELPANWKQLLLEERRHEFFCELGHRFFDLKRTGTLEQEMVKTKLSWKKSFAKLPLPQAELMLNPNLLPQNEGY